MEPSWEKGDVTYFHAPIIMLKYFNLNVMTVGGVWSLSVKSHHNHTVQMCPDVFLSANSQ